MSEGYSTVLRWEGVAKADVTPRMRHNGREAEEEAGIVAVHGNELINAAMTARNESYLWRDVVREPLTGQDPIGQMYAVAEKRWSQAQHTRLNKKTGMYTPRGTPSNASHVAEFVLQLDPKFTGPSWSQFEDTFEDGAEAYLNELEKRVDYFADVLARASAGGVDVYDAHLDAEGAQIELKEGREDVDRWRGTITERREATDVLLRAMIDKVHEWMDVDGTKANLVSDHIHRDETSPHAQIFAVPVGDELKLPGGVAERKLSLKQLLVGHSPTRSEAQRNYSERHDEMRSHINDVARAHGIDYVATMERVDNQRSNLGKTQLRRHRAEQLRQRVHDTRVVDNVVEAGDRLTKLAEREKNLSAREAAADVREQAVQTREEELPAIKRRAKQEGYDAGKAEGLQAAQEAAEEAAAEIKARAEADTLRITQRAAKDAQRVRQDAQAEAEQERQQAELDAKTLRGEAKRIKTYAEAVRGSADMTLAEAKDALDEAWQLLHTAQEITPPQINEIEFKRQMNTVDADFLDKLCEKSSQIAQNRENYRDRRRREVQWGTPQQRAALDHTVGQAQELAQKRFGVRPGSPESPQRGRQHRNGLGIDRGR